MQRDTHGVVAHASMHAHEDAHENTSRVYGTEKAAEHVGTVSMM